MGASDSKRVSWTRYTIEAELLSDAHPGTGSGGGGIDALVARDRRGHPVIWASHVEGVLRDAAHRLRGDEAASGFFGRAGGERQRAVFTSLYASENPDSHVWRAMARATTREAPDNRAPDSHVWRATARATTREAPDNRAPKEDTLRVVEYVPRGTKFSGHVELPDSELPLLRRLLQEVDAVGSGRAAGAGRVKLTLLENNREAIVVGKARGRLLLLLENIEPVCVTATATPDNIVPTLAFIPGRTLLGAIAAWLIAEGHRDVATLLVGGKIDVSDALPLPHPSPPDLDLSRAEVLPAPLSLQSEKPRGAAGPSPWWAQPPEQTRRLDEHSEDAKGLKLKRPDDDLFVYRAAADERWETFRPSIRARLRNGRPDPKQPDASLFAIEHVAEKTRFLCELRGADNEMALLATGLGPVLEGLRWLRVGRAGAPVEVVRLAWSSDAPLPPAVTTAYLTLTSDLLVRDELLRWCTALDESRLKSFLRWPANVNVKAVAQDSVMVHGFNGTSRLWRMPAAAVRRGSVFKVDGTGVAQLAQRATRGEWLGERTHEGFGRFRLDATLPGVTDGVAPTATGAPVVADADEEAAAVKTCEWFEAHHALAKPGSGSDPMPSLSQWLDLVADLERDGPNALDARLARTAGARSWGHKEARAVLDELKNLPKPELRAPHARMFVRWLRAKQRAEQRAGQREGTA